MTIVKKENIREKGITIDTTGPAGNAFYLLGVALRLGKQMEWSDKEIDKTIMEMKSSDYENLIKIFDKHFGFYVTLIRW